MKHLLLLLLIPFYSFSQTSNVGKFTLKCKFSGFSDGTEFYLMSLGKSNQRFSSILKNGEVNFDGSIEEPTVFRIEANNGPYAAFWVEKGNLELKGDSSNFLNLSFTNSKINFEHKKIENQLLPLYIKAEELYEIADKEKNIEIQKVLTKRHVQFSDSITKIRIKNLFSLEPSYPLMQELFYLRNSMPKDSMQLAFDRFPNQIQNSGNGKYLKAFVASNTVTIGELAPDIKGSTIHGDTVRLSDFRGKLVLLDFWAGWCGPCRLSNKQLVDIYSKYKDKGFEVFSFSIDTKFDEWNKASKEDGIVWTNISDLAGHYSSEAVKYRIQAIPRAFLIDRDGKVLKILKGYSEENHDLLLSYINKL